MKFRLLTTAGHLSSTVTVLKIVSDRVRAGTSNTGLSAWFDQEILLDSLPGQLSNGSSVERGLSSTALKLPVSLTHGNKKLCYGLDFSNC